ncbi:NUDIX domain-containing protein [Micromonospora sp. NPDC048170]|uniref:NUDIX hydrolase n=1 Tax=Micromonospora sp. NPDC048170 TaxID=3154819 RepID=UPI0033D2C829
MSALTWAVAAVVTDDAGRVLLCRQGRGERRYALPGGRLRPAESPVHAVLRDIRAETGWEVEIVDLVGLYHLALLCGRSPAGPALLVGRAEPALPAGRAGPALPTGSAAPALPAGRAGPLPDVLVHVFRARTRGPGPAGDPVGGCRVSWHDPGALPDALTPTTRSALTDALAGHSGVLRDAVPDTTTPPTGHPPGQRTTPPTHQPTHP